MRKRIVFLLTSILIGLAILAVAYPIATSHAALAGY